MLGVLVDKFFANVLCKGFCVEEMQKGWVKRSKSKGFKANKVLGKGERKETKYNVL